MTATAATLGERALRRLGVAVIPLAARPALASPIAVATIATNALLWLGVIAPDDDLTAPDKAPDQAFAVTKVLAVHDSLIAQGIVSWASTAIPFGVSEEYTVLAAQHLGPSFGKTIGDLAALVAIEARIRKVAMIMGAPDEATDAVVSVHADFAARGKVRWTLQDIPQEVEDVYTYLAAYQLAPLYGQKPNDTDAAQANQALDRYLALGSSGELVQAEYF